MTATRPGPTRTEFERLAAGGRIHPVVLGAGILILGALTAVLTIVLFTLTPDLAGPILGSSATGLTGTTLYRYLTRSRRRPISETITVEDMLRSGGPLKQPAWTAADERFPQVREALAPYQLTEAERDCLLVLADEHEGTVEDLVNAVKLLNP